jgi:hypothetical protein
MQPGSPCCSSVLSNDLHQHHHDEKDIIDLFSELAQPQPLHQSYAYGLRYYPPMDYWFVKVDRSLSPSLSLSQCTIIVRTI